MDPVQHTLVKVKSKLKCFLQENVMYLQTSSPGSTHVCLGYDVYTYQFCMQFHSIGFHTALQYENLYYEIV